MVFRYWMALGAVYAFLAVALGAFGAHGLKSALSPESLVVFQTGVRYHFYHSLAILLTGMIMDRFPLMVLHYAAGAFSLGVLLFSGSLYTLVLTHVSWVGVLTPVGGGLFLIGWVLLAMGVWRSSSQQG